MIYHILKVMMIILTEKRQNLQLNTDVNGKMVHQICSRGCICSIGSSTFAWPCRTWLTNPVFRISCSREYFWAVVMESISEFHVQITAHIHANTFVLSNCRWKQPRGSYSPNSSEPEILSLVRTDLLSGRAAGAVFRELCFHAPRAICSGPIYRRLNKAIKSWLSFKMPITACNYGRTALIGPPNKQETN